MCEFQTIFYYIAYLLYVKLCVSHKRDTCLEDVILLQYELLKKLVLR